MEDINSLESKFKDLQGYSDAQFHTIDSMKAEIEKLKLENNSLKQLVEGSFPNLEFGNSNHIGISNEQLICETQIFLLKEVAITRQLNADETRRFATFVDVLEKIRSNNEDKDLTLEKFSDSDLLKLVVDNGNNT